MLGGDIVYKIDANFVPSLASPPDILLGGKIVHKIDVNFYHCDTSAGRNPNSIWPESKTKIEGSKDKGTVHSDLFKASVGTRGLVDVS